jgi:hypothetical protein
MGQIEQERLVLILFDKIDRTCGIVGRKPGLVRVITRHFIPIVCRQIGKIKDFSLLGMERPHIIGIGQAVIFVETVL